MSEDRKWERRLRLLDMLLFDTVNRWCTDDDDFPCEFVLSSVLYLFSPRCDPATTTESGLTEVLLGIVQSPSAECCIAHPEQIPDQHALLIDSLGSLIAQQADRWNEGATASPASIGAFAQQLVDKIIQSKYVKFHRTQTTSRDQGGFHGLW